MSAVSHLLVGVHSKRMRTIHAVSDLLEKAKPAAQKLREHRIKADQKQDRFCFFDEVLPAARERREENFHSDVIACFLDPRRAHKLGNEPLRLFIDLLNKAGAHLKISIDRTAFDGATVERERGHIDILITNQNKECIIIESKINWASDQPGQLQNYYKKMKQSGHTIKAVVYITPDTANKYPTKQSLGDVADEINKKLIVLPAYPSVEGDAINLNYGWMSALVEYVAKELNDLDVLSSLRQYLLFLEKKRGEFMSDQIAKDLAKLFRTKDGIFNPDSFEAARAVGMHYREAIQEFVQDELTKRINKEKQLKGFNIQKLIYDGGLVFFNFIVKRSNRNYHLGIDLWERDNFSKSTIEIFARGDDTGKWRTDIRKIENEIIRPNKIKYEPHFEKPDIRLCIHTNEGVPLVEGDGASLFDTTIKVLKVIAAYADEIEPSVIGQ